MIKLCIHVPIYLEDERKSAKITDEMLQKVKM